jgi:hypothetical protein
MQDVSVRRVGREQAGILVADGSELRLDRGHVEQTQRLALSVSGSGSTATARDFSVRDTTLPHGTAGGGIQVANESSLALTRARLEDVSGNGVLVHAAELQVQDLAVREVSANPFGLWGRALTVQQGAHAQAERISVSRARDAAIAVFNEGTRAELSGVTVRDTRERACVEQDCRAAGTGLVSFGGASARMRDFRIENSPLCGVQVVNGGQLDLSGGEIIGNDIGACVQVEGYDLARLTQDVRYKRNGRNLESTRLPGPEPAPLVPESNQTDR